MGFFIEVHFHFSRKSVLLGDLLLYQVYRKNERPLLTILVNLFRTAVPFWGQNTWNLNDLSLKRDCGPKRVEDPRHPDKMSVKEVCDHYHYYTTPTTNQSSSRTIGGKWCVSTTLFRNIGKFCSIILYLVYKRYLHLGTEWYLEQVFRPTLSPTPLCAALTMSSSRMPMLILKPLSYLQPLYSKTCFTYQGTPLTSSTLSPKRA